MRQTFRRESQLTLVSSRGKETFSLSVLASVSSLRLICPFASLLLFYFLFYQNMSLRLLLYNLLKALDAWGKEEEAIQRSNDWNLIGGIQKLNEDNRVSTDVTSLKGTYDTSTPQ